MSVIYIALPVALLLALAAAVAFAACVRGGQFDDLETPPMRMLYDDDADPAASPVAHRESRMAGLPEGTGPSPGIPREMKCGFPRPEN